MSAVGWRLQVAVAVVAVGVLSGLTPVTAQMPAVTPSAALADLERGGEIVGRVVNGTAGGGDVSGTVVQLVPIGGSSPGEAVTATVGADGLFRFSDLVVGATGRYGLVATYGGVDYVAPESVDLPADSPRREDVTVSVYETATDVPLAMRTGHIVVAADPEAGLVRVAEVWVVANDSDRARVVGADGATLRFPLPSTTTEIRLEDARMRAADRMEGSTLVDSLPVPPGERQVVISYDLPYEGTAITLEREVPLATGELRLLATGAGVSIDSVELPERRSTEMQGQAVQEALGRDLAGGARITARLTGLPASSGAAAATVTRPFVPPPVGQSQLAVVGLLLAALALVLALGYPWLIRVGVFGEPGGGLAMERERLVRDIAGVDRDLANGVLSPAEHRVRRAGLMDRAIAVAREQARGEGPTT